MSTNMTGQIVKAMGPRESLAAAYERDGALLIQNAFNPAEMAMVEDAFEWRRANPGINAMLMYPQENAVYFQETGNSHRVPLFEKLLRESRAADLAAELFGSGPVWFVGEQLFLKEGGHSRRTPWHQDGSYIPFGGKKIVVMWIPLESLPAEATLEVVRGSHKGPLYNGMIFDPNDDTTPRYDHPDFPRLPDIQADRKAWDILSQPIQRGDALVFHTGTLHGGGGTVPGMRRRSLTLRFIGDDAVRTFLPEDKGSQYVDLQATDAREEQLDAIFMRLPLGAPLHHAKGVRRVRPWFD